LRGPEGAEVALGLSLALAVATLYFARAQGASGSEWELTLRSAGYASIAALPAIWALVRNGASVGEKILLGAWWPLKLAFAGWYFFEVWGGSGFGSNYLAYSDHLAFHEMAVRFVDYWRQHGFGLIPKDVLIASSINYPAAAYFFGSLYWSLGRYLGPTIPWLSLVQLLCAVIAVRVISISSRDGPAARVALHLMLWSPAIWLFTLLVHRDPLIILAWLVVALGAMLILHARVLAGTVMAIGATVVLANLRAEYLYLVFGWLTIVAVLSARNSSTKEPVVKVALLVVVAACSAFVAWAIWGGGTYLYVAKYDLAAGVAEQAGRFLTGGHGRGFYAAVLSLGAAFLIPVVIPFKLLVGLLAPFPWRFGTFELAVTQPFYSLESILRISLVLFMVGTVLRIGRRQRAWSLESKLLLTLGVLLAITAALGAKSEVRYLTPALPFLTPFFAEFAVRLKYWAMGCAGATMAIGVLHFLYAALRGGGL
jgi:hypothetical protein